MTGQPPNDANEKSVNSPGAGETSSGRTAIVLLLIAVLLTTFLAIRFIDFPGSADDDTPVLLAQTGCFDMDLVPADHDPPVSLQEAEADARGRIVEFASGTGEGPEDESDIGELLWADYGELAPGTAGRVASGHAWVLVFELQQDVSWWRRLTIQDEDARYSVIYRPETGEITAACSDPAP